MIITKTPASIEIGQTVETPYIQKIDQVNQDLFSAELEGEAAAII